MQISFLYYIYIFTENQRWRSWIFVSDDGDDGDENYE